MAIQRIFLLGGQQDIDWCRVFASTLQSAGASLWFDPNGPQMDARWVAAQDEAIRSCNLVIIIVAPHTLASRWVQHAFSIAEAAQCVIVPVVIQATTLPENVRVRQPIQATGQSPATVGHYIANLLGLSFLAPASQPQPPPALPGDARSAPAMQAALSKPHRRHSINQDAPDSSRPVAERPTAAARTRLGVSDQQATAEYSQYPPPPAAKVARRTRTLSWNSWQAMLGAGASLATILGVVLTLLTTHPLGIFAPAAPPTPVPITYQAAKPGVGCDGGAGTWVNRIGSADTHLYGSVQCEPNGLKLTNVGAYSLEAPQVLFQWPNHQFSSTYTVAVDLSSQTTHGCGGMVTNVQGLDQSGEYVYLICPDGTTSIVVASPTDGTFTTLKTGQVSAQKTYHLLVKVAGSSLTFTINHAAALSVQDRTFPTTSYIGLIVSGYPSEADESAVFAHFAYVGTQ